MDDLSLCFVEIIFVGSILFLSTKSSLVEGRVLVLQGELSCLFTALIYLVWIPRYLVEYLACLTNRLYHNGIRVTRIFDNPYKLVA